MDGDEKQAKKLSKKKLAIKKETMNIAGRIRW
jgi:hypothetical protein